MMKGTDRRIVIARIMDQYKGPSYHYTYDRMRMLPEDRYETICIYLQRCSDAPNNQEEFFRCFYVTDRAKVGGMSLTLARGLARVLREQGVDIIHASRHRATVYGTMGGALAGTPVVMGHVHGMNRCRNLRRKLLYKLMALKLTRMIGCSDGVRDDIATNYPGMGRKAVSLHNSIDYAKYHDAGCDRRAVRSALGIPDQAFVFVNVGRLVPTKGHDLLLEAFARVTTPTETRLLLVGSGPLEDDIRSQAGDLGLADRMVLAGQRDDVPQILKACDGFALSSVREGMPLCVFEAMAAGLPVIGTGEGGTAELLGNGEIGVYVPDRSAEAFAEGMLQITSLSKKERQGLVARADKKVRTVYNHERAVEQLQQIYEDALAQQGVH